MAERVLVTGGHGFVGAHLVRALEASGHDVIAPSREEWDLRTSSRPSLPTPDCVIHLAGRTFVPDSWTNASAFIEANVLGTVNVLEFCRAVRARLVFVSSYVYGIPQTLPIDEQHPLSAVNPYGLSKIVAEDAARFYERQLGINLTIIRPFNVYGPGQSPQFLIPTIIRQALDEGTEAIELNELSSRRDYLHVSDLARLLVMTVRSVHAGVYNAGSGTSYSVQAVVELVQRAANTTKPIRAKQIERPNEIHDVVADISRASADLGWKPVLGLAEGLADTVCAARRALPS